MANTTKKSNKKSPKLNIVQEMLSVLAAFIGVQSRRNRVRDFQHGDHRRFIIIGLLFTVLFVAILITVVLKIVA